MKYTYTAYFFQEDPDKQVFIINIPALEIEEEKDLSDIKPKDIGKVLRECAKREAEQALFILQYDGEEFPPNRQPRMDGYLFGADIEADPDDAARYTSIKEFDIS